MQGKSKGWMFLIEIPGNLFTKAHLRAGVFCRHNNPERLLYVLFDGTGSEVVLFNDDEAPDSANKLALSYANVIRQLNDTAGAFSLH